MSENLTDFDAFNKFLIEDRAPDPAVRADFSGRKLTNALSFMRGVELYWAYHVDMQLDDYPDQFTDEQREQIHKKKVVHAGYVNKAWARVLAGDFAVIDSMDQLERADPQNPGKWPESVRQQIEAKPLEVYERHSWKHEEFIEQIIPVLDVHIFNTGY